MMKMPIRVLHVIPQIVIGGAEMQLYALIVNSDPQVVTHEVLYYNDSQDKEGFKLYTEAGIKYAQVPRSRKRPIRFLRDLTAAIKARKPDIVHCWLWGGNIWGRWAAILAGVKNIIVAYRGGYLCYPAILKVLEKFTTKKVHHLANSRACANMTAEKIGVSPDRFHVIYNGINLEKYSIFPVRRKVFEGLDIPEDVTIVTMVGRLAASKNFPMLLNIARRCKDKQLPVHFLIVGYGEKENELIGQANQLEVTDIVHFLGLRHDIPEILKSSDIFCFTTLYEGFPNVLLEAMAAGLPIITTNFDGVDELINDGVNGRIVTTNDVDGVYLALKSYLDNPEVVNGFAEKARETVEKRFTMELMVQNTIRFYSKLLTESSNECP